MAKYRQIHLTFWHDPFIEDLSPMEKYFYLYLMTNSRTTQCGCYEISMKLIKYETGLTQKQIDEYVKVLSKGQKIRFNESTNEFLIMNWLKHNSFRSPKVLKCVLGEVESVKHTLFKDFIKAIISGNDGMDSLSIVYDTPIDSGLQEEQEEEQEEEDNNNKKNKKKYLDFVLLTEDEYEKLIEKFGDRSLKAQLENLNNYIGSTGKKYKSHYHTILSWSKKNGDDKKKVGKRIYD